LFLYSAHLTLEDHLAMLKEMLRVAAEVRVFPLVDLNAQRSPHLDPVLAALRDENIRTKIGPVPYRFQTGGNEMLKIYR
jgi:hypothetical protein